MTAPETFLWSGVYSGVKKSGKLDVGLAYSSYPSTVAGVFTANAFSAAPVREARRRLKESRQYHGLVVNSGVANAATGPQGVKNNRDIIREAAKRLGLEPKQVLSASTGHIGEPLPVEAIREALPKAVDSLGDDPTKFARAILTTDTTVKTVTRRVPELGATLTGVAKGAGMIRPCFATMLAFVFFDHPVESEWWQAILEEAVATSFNQITVDGENSTNDTVLAFGADIPNRDPVDEFHSAAGSVDSSLSEVCRTLSREIVADGEGSTRLIEVKVREASDRTVAEAVADSIANSNLLKAALYGGDPNWGRVYSAIGATQYDLDPEAMTISFDGFTVYDPQEEVRETPQELVESMQSPGTHEIMVTLGQGSVEARRLTCDLTEEYVRINADYEP